MKDLKTVMYKPRVPVYVGKKIMSMASLFTTLTSSLLLGLHLHERDGLWEVACAPHSWLTEAAEEHNLKPRRINLAQGYDLYQTSTWDQLRDLRQRHRPRRLWFSLPCTKWCAWTSVNYNTPERRDKLETARRRERRLLWQVNKFIKEATDEDPEIQVYFEWPHPCFGWKQAPMQDLERHLEHRGLPWLQCRIDGCNYGMKDQAGVNFLQKKWLIKTTDENFHRVFEPKYALEIMGNMLTSKGMRQQRAPTTPGSSCRPSLDIGDNMMYHNDIYVYLLYVLINQHSVKTIRWIKEKMSVE